MKINEEKIRIIFQGAKAIRKLGEREGVAFEEVEASIQEAIDEGWSNPDSTIQEHWSKHFPDGKPSPSEFVGRMAGIVGEGRGEPNSKMLIS